MDNLEDLLVAQRLAIGSMCRVLVNYKKLGKAKMCTSNTEGRLRILQENWNRCVELHSGLHFASSDEERANEKYFVNEEFETAEGIFLEAYDYFNEQLANFKAASALPAQPTALNATGNAEASSAAINLPRIVLPKFSGLYKDWLNFKDLFQSLIHENSSLTDVQKLHYLKSTLEGEASKLLQHVTINATNYASCWKLLTERYDNNRVLIQTQLSILFDLPSASDDNVDALKTLRDVTREVLSILSNLGCPTDSWGHLIVYMTTNKLDKPSLREWEMTLGACTEYPTFDELDKFLIARIRSLESIQLVSSNSSPSAAPASLFTGSKKSKSSVHAHSTSTTNEPPCPCGARHRVNICFKFKRLNVAKRKEFLRSQRRCFNCFRPGHFPSDCPSPYSCQKCGQRHHSLLHYASEAVQDPGNTTTSASSTDSAAQPTSGSASPATEVKSISSVHLNSLYESSLLKQNVFLATAIVTVKTTNGRHARVRALLDQGSEATFVFSDLVRLLRAKQVLTATRVSGVGDSFIGIARSRVSLTVASTSCITHTMPITALVLPKLSALQARVPLDISRCPHLNELLLADPDPSGSAPISLIIGADYYGSLLREGLRQGPPGSLTAQSTIFGWVLSGSVRDNSARNASVSHVSVSHCLTTEEPLPPLQSLCKLLSRFWEIEEISTTVPLSEEDRKCEDHFCRTHSRTSDGRYIVRLPFKQDPPINVGESYSRARVLLNKVWRRLDRNPALREPYLAFMSEYIDLEHMYEAPSEASTITFPIYLPHHPVLKESSSTTKLRVVFNASGHTLNSTFLNDHLLTGPKLQADIMTIVTAWRRHPYVYKADLQKMFRQICVDPQDQDYQRILWCSSSADEPVRYRLATVTYGTACAPYLANRVLLQLADDEGMSFPRAREIVRHNFYVDDAFFGAFEPTTAKELRDELISLMSKGGFTLHKWSSNCTSLLQDDIALEASPILTETSDPNHQKVLGIAWNPLQDSFRFSFELPPLRELTKRSVLSIISRLYDPLGWLTPTIIKAKIFMQDLWLSGIDWDESLSNEQRAQWATFSSSLLDVHHLRVPRWLGLRSPKDDCELHGFADASTRAYAAVVFLRVVSSAESATVSLIAAKSKVAPLKTLSVPRLELSAAVLLSRLMKRVMDDLGLHKSPVHAWSDSTVALAWLSKHPATWQTFVANRVSEIHTTLPSAVWHHVSSQDNPADCASRGVTPMELQHHALWWNGPPWLRFNATEWPVTSTLDPLESLPERKLHLAIAKPNKVSSDLWTTLSHNVSSWSKLLRVTGILFRFRDLLRHQIVDRSHYFGVAKEFWIMFLQKTCFNNEQKCLVASKPIQRSSPIWRLNPYLDERGIIRVGGRLKHASLPEDSRHPIVLPVHRVTELLVRHCHVRSLHGGTQLTLAVLRQEFWVITSRRMVKSIINQCVSCIRQRAAVPQQLMADLPSVRVTPTRSFSNVGVDYAGPYLVRTSKGRGHKSHKAYLALFVCLATRAIHLELVSDYSTPAFLAALKRFVSRRGLPTTVYSDNGTTFVGASSELKLAIRTAMSSPKLLRDPTYGSISWHFIPPGCPHFGGIWEAGVKSTKHHLKRVLGIHTLTYEEFSTLLCQIEACLNSRPLVPLSDDPEDLTPLTPGHFLIGCPLLALPEPSVYDVQSNLLNRWKLVTQMVEHFWSRWRDEYLQGLQQRGKWVNRSPNIEIGQLVIIRSPNLPPAKWHLGRVIKCHPGPDGLVRVVTLRTQSGEVKRPIGQVVLLPVEPSQTSA